ncbi:MAG TPA: ACP S-malonyltransferase [Thermoleophilaceae bacterium]
MFPGQGSQTPDMGEIVRRACPHLAVLAERLSGRDPFSSYAEGTRFLQPAIYTASIAHWTERGAPEAGWLAGHSLGEISALAAAGSLSVEDGLRLVITRGRAMQRAARSAPEPGGMLAVAADMATCEELAERHGAQVANDNAPDQVVLSGPRSALQALRKDARAAKVKAVMLPVEGALHSSAMQPAVAEFEHAIREIDFSPPRVPVFSCVTAEPIEDIPAQLVQSLTSRVRWREIVMRMRERGVERFSEVGPGAVLSGLIRRTLGSDSVVPVRGAGA